MAVNEARVQAHEVASTVSGNIISHRTIYPIKIDETRYQYMCLSTHLGEASHLLLDNRVRQASLLDSLRWVCQLLGWETGLQLIWPCGSWP
jgi:hypothetical protein